MYLATLNVDTAAFLLNAHDPTDCQDVRDKPPSDSFT